MPLLTSGSRLIRHKAATSNGLLTNLIAYWGLDEAGGANNALDKHSNGLTLAQSNSPGSDTGLVYAGARTFTTASAQYFARASEANLQLGDIDFTLAAWVYLTNKDVVRGIVGKWLSTGNQRAFQIDYDNASNRFRLALSPNGTTQSVLYANNYGSPPLNTWLFACAWYDSVIDIAYLSINNGTANSVSHAGGAFGTSTAQFEVGRAYGSSYWNGRIGPVAMWKRALDATARTTLYNAGAGLTYAAFTA